MINETILNHRFFANFFKFRYLLKELVKRDIKIKYRRSVLGIFWSFLEPLLFMIVLTIIFSTVFKHSIENYPVYLLCGRLAFDLYAGGTGGALGSIVGNSSMLKKIYIPKYMYPLSVTLSTMITFLLSLIVLFMIMLATHTPFTFYMFTAIVPIVLLLVFTIGVGLIISAATVFFRDIEHLYGVFLTLLMYGSAIMFPADIVPANYQFLLTWNPLFAFITLFRDAFLYGQWLEPFYLAFATVSAIVALVVGILVFYKYQDRFILHI